MQSGHSPYPKDSFLTPHACLLLLRVADAVIAVVFDIFSLTSLKRGLLSLPFLTTILFSMSRVFFCRADISYLSPKRPRHETGA